MPAELWTINLNLAKNELQNARIQNLASTPASPVEGQIWHNTTDRKLYVFDGTDAVPLATGAGVSFGTPSATINAGDSATAGVAATALRSDAQFAISTGAAENITGSNAEGDSTALARADHDHALGAGSVALAALAAGIRLDTINAPTAAVALNNQKITGLANGTDAGDAVNLGQLQTSQAGLDAKPSVRAATTAAGTLASSFENGDTIDGVVLATGDRILVKDQAAPAENGVYVVAATGVPTRADDANSWSELVSAFVFVEEGTVNADTGFLSTVNAGGTLGTTAVTFTQFSGAGTFNAGSGLTKTGNTFDVGGTVNRISVAADAIDISASYVGQTSITTLGTITTGTWNGNDIAVADGGTGSGTAEGARTNLGAAGVYTSATHDAGSSISIPQSTHGLRATRGIAIQVQEESSGDVIKALPSVAANGDVTVSFNASQNANTVRVTLVG